MTDYLSLKVFVQEICEELIIHNTSIYLPTGLYMESPNSTYYKLDGKQFCNMFGFCHTATAIDTAINISHTPRDFSKKNGDICKSASITFQLGQDRSLHATRKCKDLSLIEVYLKQY